MNRKTEKLHVMNIRHMELFACPAARIPTEPCWQNAIVMTASTTQVIYSEITAFFSLLHPTKYIGLVLALYAGQVGTEAKGAHRGEKAHGGFGESSTSKYLV